MTWPWWVGVPSGRGEPLEMQAARVRATGPEPGEGFTGHLREEVGGRPGSRRFLRLLLLFCKRAFVVGNFALEVAPDEVVVVSG